MGCCVAWRPSFTEIPSLIVAVSLHFMPRLPAFHVHVSTNIKAPDCSGKNKLRDQITHHHATRHHTRRHTQRDGVKQIGDLLGLTGRPPPGARKACACLEGLRPSTEPALRGVGLPGRWRGRRRRFVRCRLFYNESKLGSTLEQRSCSILLCATASWM